MTRSTIAVLGGGSFGTAIANMASLNKNHAILWMRDAEQARKSLKNKENAKYLPGYALSDTLDIRSDLVGVLGKADLVCISVPSRSFRALAKQISPLIKSGTPVISTTKGI